MNNVELKILEVAQNKVAVVLTEETDLFAAGYDSLMIMELIVEVEFIFNKEIPPNRLSKDNLRNVASIALSIQGEL